MEIIAYIAGAIICGFIGGTITEGKGRRSGEGFALGLILGIIGIIIAAVLPRNEKTIEQEALIYGTSKKCPYCAEIIKQEAVVCKHCGRDLPSNKELSLLSEETIEESSDTSTRT